MKQYDETNFQREKSGWATLLRERIPGLEKTVISRENIREDNSGGLIESVKEKLSQHDGKTPYLEVTGSVGPKDPEAPEIRWKLLLPFCWNGRSLQIGGGANNGRIPDLEGEMLLSRCCPVEKGYVVFGDDSGHQSDDPMSAEFAANGEALQNYIRSHLIKALDVMRFVVKLCYGRDAEKVYFAGGSAGGREALECATSYGKDYDGIFCADPVYDFVFLRMWGALLSKAVYDSYDPVSHPASDGFIDEETVAAIQRDAVRRYDGLDGIEDGVISNIYAARMDRDSFMEEIREKYGLTQAQMDTISVYEDGFDLDYLLGGRGSRYRGCCALEGGLMDLGPDPVPREPLDTRYNVHHGDRADGVFKYFITGDRNWKLIGHDYRRPDEKLLEMLTEASKRYDIRPDFDDFIGHGGRMILFTSWNDMSISPWQIAARYGDWVKKYGQSCVDDFVRFYVMPAATHCSGIRMDYLDWLDRWCTKGEYPSGTLYGFVEAVEGEMPMARFPGWVKYRGGDPKKGTSYEVSMEIPEGFFERFG